MFLRLGKVIVALPLVLAGILAGAEPAECISCGQADDWVCCSPSSDECDTWKLDYCNLVSDPDNPFEQECGWN